MDWTHTDGWHDLGTIRELGHHFDGAVTVKQFPLDYGAAFALPDIFQLVERSKFVDVGQFFRGREREEGHAGMD